MCVHETAGDSICAPAPSLCGDRPRHDPHLGLQDRENKSLLFISHRLWCAVPAARTRQMAWEIWDFRRHSDGQKCLEFSCESGRCWAGAEALGGMPWEPSQVFLTWGNCALWRGLSSSLLPVEFPEQSWLLRVVLPAGVGEGHSPRC